MVITGTVLFLILRYLNSSDKDLNQESLKQSNGLRKSANE